MKYSSIYRPLLSQFELEFASAWPGGNLDAGSGDIVRGKLTKCNDHAGDDGSPRKGRTVRARRMNTWTTAKQS